MKFGIYPGGRAGTVCSHPPDAAAIRHLVDDLSNGRPFVIREYVHFLGFPQVRIGAASWFTA
ncbi:hypothetical protein [Micromonospora zamorensis]|uniref:hypothetical protein n=1 Tax=Micromonospora zamorensis TaxID=709883 RepID=UPI003CF17C77